MWRFAEPRQPMPDHLSETRRRRTFAIISHPDAGKTTLTEKLLLFGGAIQMAGSVKSRKAARHATSDWMALEKERGISVTVSVMQFPYEERIVNLLDTPGHADFSEDTYRVLTAVDSALMVIDCAKGVEERTIKLMEVCRLRDTPIMTFINKLDREGRSPIDLLDEVESVLRIQCAPVTWPIGMGKRLKGVYHLLLDEVHIYEPGRNFTRQDSTIFKGLDDPALPETHRRRGAATNCARSSSWCRAPRIRSTTRRLSRRQADAGVLRLGGEQFRRAAAAGFLRRARAVAAPRAHDDARSRSPRKRSFTGFVFKIQANMDPQHRDRVAFLRVCSGSYRAGMKALQVRTGKEVKLANALTFMASDREIVETAYPGDVIGLHNHGTISIGDTFTEGEALDVHRHPELRAGTVPPRAPARSAEDEGAAEGPGAVVRGRRDAVLPPADVQRPDPRRGRRAAVRRGRLPAEGRIRRRRRVRERSASSPRAGSAAATRRSWRNSARRTR